MKVRIKKLLPSWFWFQKWPCPYSDVKKNLYAPHRILFQLDSSLQFSRLRILKIRYGLKILPVTVGFGRYIWTINPSPTRLALTEQEIRTPMSVRGGNSRLFFVYIWRSSFMYHYPRLFSSILIVILIYDYLRVRTIFDDTRKFSRNSWSTF